MFQRPPRPVSVTLNLAPMVDVMMCLIVFFLLASRLVSAQLRPIELPSAKAARQLDPKEVGTRVVVNVRPAPTDPKRVEYVMQRWDGREVVERLVSSDELPSVLAARAEQSRARGDDLACVIRADRSIASGYVETVLRACGLAKIGRIVFAASSEDEREDRP